MLRLLVIADDFTGALDTGVHFSNQGTKTLVTTDSELDFNHIDKNIEVLVIDTESRYLNFDDAYRKVKNIIEKSKQINIPHIYKKVDSALRGNISAEIKAIMDSTSESIIPFLPAYPEMNRVLQDGNLYIDDELVSESIFAEDPYEPVTESNVLKRLNQEADIEGHLIKGIDIPRNVSGLMVFDSRTDEEMEQQLIALKELNLLSVTIGCAGFAKNLAKQLFPNSKTSQYSIDKPLIVISGSVNPITKKQIEYSEAKNYPRISLIAKQLLNTDYWASTDGQRDINSYLNLIEEHPLIVFETLSDSTTEAIDEYSQESDEEVSSARFKIGESLGNLTQELWSKNSNNTFLFTGGDTLFQAMKVLGVKNICPLAEISAGVVLSTIEWKRQTRNVITKSGGFGNENLFEEISQID